MTFSYFLFELTNNEVSKHTENIKLLEILCLVKNCSSVHVSFQDGYEIVKYISRLQKFDSVEIKKKDFWLYNKNALDYGQSPDSTSNSQKRNQEDFSK